MNAATERLQNQFKALADPVRLRIVALCEVSECSVTELTRVLAQSQPRISQHVKQLCAADLLERYRDGHFVYYRVPMRGAGAASRRRLLALMPAEEPAFDRDLERLRELRTAADSDQRRAVEDPSIRRLHRALVGLTVAAPLGDLLDIGCGEGRVLKLLASRAHRAVGVDIDSDARRLARAQLLNAGIENTAFRNGDMYALPFDDAQFDTVILDDVLAGAERPVDALLEARRLLRPGGRLLLLSALDDENAAAALRGRFADWCRDADMRLAPPQAIPAGQPQWLLAVARATESGAAAA